METFDETLEWLEEQIEAVEIDVSLRQRFPALQIAWDQLVEAQENYEVVRQMCLSRKDRL